VVTSEAKKACSKALQEHGISERRACRLAGVNRSTVRYQAIGSNDEELERKIKLIAFEKRRYGYRRIHMLLKRKGEKVFRIYNSPYATSFKRL